MCHNSSETKQRSLCLVKKMWTPCGPVITRQKEYLGFCTLNLAAELIAGFPVNLSLPESMVL